MEREQRARAFAKLGSIDQNDLMKFFTESLEASLERIQKRVNYFDLMNMEAWLQRNRL